MNLALLLFRSKAIHSSEGMVAVMSAWCWYGMHGQETEMGEWFFSDNLLLFVQSGSPVYGTAPQKYRVVLPVSNNYILKIPHRHFHEFISRVILDPVKVTININHSLSYISWCGNIPERNDLMGERFNGT